MRHGTTTGVLPCRFHKSTQQWFRRHEDGQPFKRSDTYEEGTYIYFDYQLTDRHDSWVFRLKQNYRLPFAQLENELPPV
jgi:CCR4-NOT transcriptional regulation complex NOT5 subunit